MNNETIESDTAAAPEADQPRAKRKPAKKAKPAKKTGSKTKAERTKRRPKSSRS